MGKESSGGPLRAATHSPIALLLGTDFPLPFQRHRLLTPDPGKSIEEPV